MKLLSPNIIFLFLYLISINNSYYKLDLIEFKDKNLEKVIRYTINKPDGILTKNDLNTITRLDANSRGIRYLDGLDLCINIKELYISNNYISELEPLANLKYLSRLDISFNSLNNINSLSKLYNLEDLHLDYNSITNLDGLTNLIRLNTLFISFNKVSDISFLSNLTNLEVVFLRNNRIQDISALTNLTNLSYVDLASNLISDLSPLVNNKLGNLTVLNVDFNPLNDSVRNEQIRILKTRNIDVTWSKKPDFKQIISNTLDISENEFTQNAYEKVQILDLSYLYLYNIDGIEDITHCINLKELSINGELINNDLEYLNNLKNLEYLCLDLKNNIDFSPLIKLKHLSRLKLNYLDEAIIKIQYIPQIEEITVWGNKINNVSSLSNLLNLRKLNLEGSYLKDISFAEKLRNLKSLYLSRMNVSDIAPISNLTNLEYLYLAYLPIQDLSPLSKLYKLKHLIIDNSYDYNDFAPISSLNNLEELQIYDGIFHDIRLLNNLKKLKKLTISGGEITDLCYLDNIENLNSINLSNNSIKDINTLVSKSMFKKGVFLILRGNPLSEKTIKEDIPLLEARGVKVYYDKTDDYDPCKTKLPDETNKKNSE